jgi:hypothetical protein
LELNNANQINGDLVTGVYGANSGYQSDANGSTADEDANYDRRDFIPSISGTTTLANTAFVARMRRANETPVPGVSSAGPTLPWLFGWGTMMEVDSGTGTRPQWQGITVRATAIAAAGTVAGLSQSSSYTVGLAKTVGRSYVIPPSPENGAGGTISGLAPFALESDFWAAVSSSSSTLTLVATLSVTTSSNVELQANQSGAVAAVGMALSTTADAFGHVAAPATAIGQPLSLLVASSSGNFDQSAFMQDAPSGSASIAEYVPIYNTTTIGGQPMTIIGFGFLAAGQWSYIPANPPLQPQATLSITPPSGTLPATHIAGQNASGVIGLPLPAALGQSGVITLFQAHSGLANPLYAPVLVDHYIGPH